MRYRKGLIFICLIICLFSIASVCASEVNDTVVANEDQIEIDNGNDDVIAAEEQDVDDVGATEENELSATSGTFSELNNEISKITDGGILNLTKNYQYSSGSRYGITISKPMTINGNGFYISGLNASRIFKITADNVTFNNIKFIDNTFDHNAYEGYGNMQSGYVVYCNSGTVNFNNCIFENSMGAVDSYETYIDNCTLIKSSINSQKGNVSNCTLIKSSIRSHNGKVNFCNAYDGSSISGNNMNISLCNFYKSIIYLFNSNMIYCNFNGGSTSQFSGNVTNSNFKDIMLWVNGSTYVGECNFSDLNKNAMIISYGHYLTDKNTPYAGALIANGEVIVSNCNFLNNTLNPYNNYYQHDLIGGSAICVRGKTIEIYNCKFFNNKIVQSPTYLNKGGGGAIHLASEYGIIKNCLFENNSAFNEGGAIYLNYQILDNGTPGYKDGMNWYYENDVYVECIAEIDNCTFINNFAPNGGAIYESNNGTTIINSKFINNSVNNNGGAVYINCDLDYLSNCLFDSNQANGNGGAILWNGSDGVISNSKFFSNNAINGGAIYLTGERGTIKSSNFLNNSATQEDGIYIVGSNVDIKDSILITTTNNPVLFTERYIVTANYNWWGNTINNFNTKPNLQSKIDVKNWLFLNVTCNKNNLKVGDFATITCDLTYLTTVNGVKSKYYAFDLSVINLTAETDYGVSTPIILIEGMGQLNYIATKVPKGSVTIKYGNINETFYFNISKGEIQLNISDTAILKGNLLVNAPNNAEGIVYVVINNKNYTANMFNGKASVSIKDLTLGTYLITTSFESDSYNVNTFNAYITIKPSIDANDLSKAQDSATKFQAIFYDYDGFVLKNTKVTFMLNGELQTATTDNNGVASLDINLSPDTYDITSLNPVTDETRINKIIITSSGEPSTDNNNTSSGNTDSNNTGDNSNQTSNDPKPINENQIIIPSLNTGFGTIKLPNDANGIITLDIAGKQYEFVVVNGICDIKVPELENGAYGYIITYSGDGNYSSFSKTGSLTVNKPSEQTTPTTPAKPVTKTTLTLKKVKVKRSAKKLTIQATLKVNGKVVKGKIIKFKFNKKTYKAKTNAKGVAKITVKKSVLKKLKNGKKVTYTATYDKITKKVTVKVK